MKQTTSHEVRLVSRSSGIPSPAHFALEQIELSALQETVVEGIDHAVGAFLGLFEGKNMGKVVVKLA